MSSSFRIVSVCPSNTEMLFHLGFGSYVVGVDQYSDYPAEVKLLPQLGPDLNIDVKAVRALKPDLVVSSLSVPGMERVVEQLEEAGLNQITLSSSSFDGMFEDMRRIVGAVPERLVRQCDITSNIAALQSRIERIRNWTSQLNGRPSLYWEWWPKPVFSPGRDNWLTELSHLAGGRNIFDDIPGPQVRDEDGTRVTEANPDVMLAVWTGIPQAKVPLPKILDRHSFWQETNAFRNKRVYVLSEGLFCRPSPRLIEGLEQLVGLLYPEAIMELGLDTPSFYAPIRLPDGFWLGRGEQEAIW